MSTGSRASCALAFVAIVLGTGCGTAHYDTSQSIARARAAEGTSSAAETLKRHRDEFGDYDNDDIVGTPTEADNDDEKGPTDVDGDVDSHTKGTYDKDDDRIRGFGHPAATRDRRAITALLRRYYEAASRGQGAEGCALMASVYARAIPEELGEGRAAPPYYRGTTCSRVLTKVFSLNHRQLGVFAATLHVLQVRVAHNEAIALLTFATGSRRRYMRLVAERDTWKIGSVYDAELP